MNNCSLFPFLATDVTIATNTDPIPTVESEPFTQLSQKWHRGFGFRTSRRSYPRLGGLPLTPSLLPKTRDE